jgi:YbbR domain-containing protein
MKKYFKGFLLFFLCLSFGGSLFLLNKMTPKEVDVPLQEENISLSENAMQLKVFSEVPNFPSNLPLIGSAEEGFEVPVYSSNQTTHSTQNLYDSDFKPYYFLQEMDPTKQEYLITIKGSPYDAPSGMSYTLSEKRSYVYPVD